MERDVLVHCFILWRSRAVYMMKRTGKIGEPCGVPTSIERGSTERLLKHRRIYQSVRKEHSHLMKGPRKLSFSKTQTSLVWLILSKYP